MVTRSFKRKTDNTHINYRVCEFYTHCLDPEFEVRILILNHVICDDDNVTADSEFELGPFCPNTHNYEKESF